MFFISCFLWWIQIFFYFEIMFFSLRILRNLNSERILGNSTHKCGPSGSVSEFISKRRTVWNFNFVQICWVKLHCYHLNYGHYKSCHMRCMYKLKIFATTLPGGWVYSNVTESTVHVAFSWLWSLLWEARCFVHMLGKAIRRFKKKVIPFSN